MAELTPEQKNQVSHRAKAVGKLVPILESLFSSEHYPTD
jgi:inosine/xanthosine triphosphate pyrophosphatase family protein